jgi:hypothetical protein
MFRRTIFSPLCLGLAAAGVLAGAGCEAPQETVAPPSKLHAMTAPAEPSSDFDPNNAQFMSPGDLAAQADVPLYPGAETPTGASSVKVAKEGTHFEIIEYSTDLPDAVLKFYGGKLKKPETMPGGKTLMGVSPKGYYVSVQADRSNDKTHIAVEVVAELAKK